MTWIIPTNKYRALRKQYHTCTCRSQAERVYKWREMHVVDADFEQPDIKSGRRRIWHTIGCHSCGNQVLDSLSFGAGKTGYNLLQEARSNQFLAQFGEGFHSPAGRAFEQDADRIDIVQHFLTSTPSIVGLAVALPLLQ